MVVREPCCSVDGSNLLVLVLQHKRPLAPSAGFCNRVKCVLILELKVKQIGSTSQQADEGKHKTREKEIMCVCVRGCVFPITNELEELKYKQENT